MKRSIVITITCLAILWSLAPTWLPAQGERGSGATDFGERLPGIPSPVLDELANRPGRPLWAPLDVLWGHSEVVPQLLEILGDAGADDRARAAFVLGQIGCPEAMDALYAARCDNDRTVRVHAGIALAYLGDKRGLSAACAALISAPPWVRFYAIIGLWRLSDPAAWAALNRSQPMQPPFLHKVIYAALQTRGGLPTMPEATVLQPPLPPLSSADIWESVGDACLAEADWWWHKGDYDQVIRCLQVVVFMQPEMVDTYGDAAWLQWSMGYNTEAIGTYHRGIQTNPNNPEAYFNLGFHYYNTRQYESAIKYLRQAADLGGRQVIRRTYAHALEKSGRIEASLQQWEKMLQETPDQPVVQNNYERVRRLAGEQAN